MELDDLPPLSFVGKQGSFTVQVDGGHIAAIEPCDAPASHLALPPFHDLHVHANRAYSLTGGPPQSFEDAVEMAVAGFAKSSFDDFFDRSARLYRAAVAHGTGKMRTHADIDQQFGCCALEASIAAARDQDLVEVEFVAFLSGRVDPRHRAAQAMIADAAAAGATHLGAVPNFYDRPDRVIDCILELARDLELDVDLHLDEHLDPDRSFSAYLAHQAQHHHMGGRVSLGHGCAISALPDQARRDAIAAIADAEICLIALPTTNLYLQDRGKNSPRLRGMAPIGELLNAGVSVRLASDNVQDAFYPYGSADMVDILALAIIAAQVDDEVALVQMACGGRHLPRPGDRADLTLFEGSSIRDIAGAARHKRMLVKSGRLIGAKA